MTARTWPTALLLGALTATFVGIPPTSHAAGDTIVVTTTIQAAVNVADPGDTVLVPAGTYAETVNVTEPGITIRGSHRAVLDGSELGLQFGIRVRSLDGSRLDGFTLDGLTIRGYSLSGSQVSGVDNFRLTGTKYVDNPLYGLFPVRCSNGRVDHNYVSGSFDSGVYVGQCNDVRVDHNVAHLNTIGLEVELSTRIVVENNVSTNNAVGALVQISPLRPLKVTQDVIVRRNVLSGNNQPNTITEGFLGALPGGVGIANVAGDDVRIIDNVVSGNRSAGIGVVSLPPEVTALDPLLDPSPDGGEVRGNVARGNGFNPDPRLAPLPGADVVWDLTGSPCFTRASENAQLPRRPAGLRVNAGNTSPWDAVVVGAGLGGLTTAAYLAANGLRTLVLEQGKVAGGCSQVFRRRGRFEFDVGVHYVGDCQPGGTMWRVLHGLGLHESVEFTELDPDGYSTLEFPDLTFRVPRGWDAYQARLLETFPSEERGIRRCVGALRRIGAELSGNFPVGTREVMTFPRKAPLTTAIGAYPLAWLYGACRLSIPVRAVLSGESGAYAAPPSRVPVSLHAAFLHHYLQAGAFYPRGGGQVLAARLVEVIEAYGSEVWTDSKVQRILVTGGRVTGVRTSDDAVHRSPVVVSNADPQRTYLELVGREHVRTRTARRMHAARMALPIFSVYLGLDLDVATLLPSANVFSHPHPDLEATYQEIYAGRLPDKLPVFLSSASVKDPGNPRTAPPGHSTLELMTVVPAGAALWGVEAGDDRLAYRAGSSYRNRKQALTEDLVERATTVVPTLSQHVILREASTPITQERFTGATGGACYGWELSTGQVGLGRPGPGTEIGGLFLVGASTRWCHGVVGVMNGGVGTAAAVLAATSDRRSS